MKELFNGEYTIPEGYIANIENDKIIVKKEESEDERIIHWIKKELEAKYVTDNIVNNEIADKALAWLEKQGADISSFPKEQQVFMRKYVSLDKITLIKLLAERDANNAEIIESFEKQGEQNPYSGVSFKYNGHTWGMCARDNGVDILLDKQLFKHLEKQDEQKPAWSEEDENGLKK